MRISDWSSDVCSSDLVSLASLVSAPAMAGGTVTGATQAPFAHEVTNTGSGAATDPLATAQGFGFDIKAPDILIGRTSTSGDVTVFVTFSGADVAKIGRASCRERVCQYV